MTPQTQLIISQHMTCLFETGKPELSLSSVEDLDDGRGYTCGWAGFTTADEEVVACVEEYTRLVPVNNLLHFLSWLKHLRDVGSSDVEQLGLRDFPRHWQNACSNPKFQQAYATVVAQKFGVPAQKHCDELGLKLPVAYAILFDSCVQHGNEATKDEKGNWTNPDGVPAMIARVEHALSRLYRERSDVPEKVWLQMFLKVREQTLLDPHNRETAAAWRESVSRVEALEYVLEHNPQLSAPVRVLSSEHDCEVTL